MGDLMVDWAILAILSFGGFMLLLGQYMEHKKLTEKTCHVCNGTGYARRS